MHESPMFHPSIPASGPANPFRASEASAENPEARYWRMVQELARHFIYDSKDLDPHKIERDIDTAVRTSGSLETTHRAFESLRYLLKGIEAHERANEIYDRDWQRALAFRAKSKDGLIESLTRDEVAILFDAFSGKYDLMAAEKTAVECYEGLLRLRRGSIVQLSQNISLHQADIEVLVNDIRARTLERVKDDGQRRAGLEDLDRELTEIIASIPEDQQGKSLEIQEIYLLRRLIHAADTGHVVAVTHSTPRDDLNPDRGSVDVKITAAGTAKSFQLKTFNSGAIDNRRAIQWQALGHAERQLKGSATHLVVLDSGAVRNAYDSAISQTGGRALTLMSKYTTLQPLIEAFDPQERSRLLVLLGLTEEQLATEKVEFDKKYAERLKHEEEMRLRREDEMRLRRISDERIALMEQRAAEEAAAEEAREERRRERQAAVSAEALRRIGSASAASLEKRAEVERRMEESVRLAEERRAEEARVAAENAALAEKKKKRDEKREQKKKTEVPKWRPSNLKGLCTSEILVNVGFLVPNWNNDANLFRAAKERFLQRFVDLKEKEGVQKRREESDRPNKLFNTAFPSIDSLKSPTNEDRERWQELEITPRADLSEAA